MNVYGHFIRIHFINISLSVTRDHLTLTLTSLSLTEARNSVVDVNGKIRYYRSRKPAHTLQSVPVFSQKAWLFVS